MVIAFIAAGVFLEVAANVVQLAESDLVHQALSSAIQGSVPAKVHAALRAALH